MSRRNWLWVAVLSYGASCAFILLCGWSMNRPNEWWSGPIFLCSMITCMLGMVAFAAAVYHFVDGPEPPMEKRNR